MAWDIIHIIVYYIYYMLGHFNHWWECEKWAEREVGKRCLPQIREQFDGELCFRNECVDYACVNLLRFFALNL